MINTKKQLIVTKADSTCEPYMHTKIIGTIFNALACTAQPDTFMAQNLAEVVTYYIYSSLNEKFIASNLIFSIIKATLASADYQHAAAALEDHHCRRKIRRSRTFVAPVDISRFSDASVLCSGENFSSIPWEKGTIVSDLMRKQKINRQTARTIASMVEEKIFQMALTLVPTSLINQLVWADTAKVTRAHAQLVN